MNTLSQVLFPMALVAAVAPAFAETPAASAKTLRDKLAQTHLALPLEYAARDNSYYVAVQINGKPGRLQLDSGAAQSCFNLRSLAKFGLTATESGTIPGVGGAGKSYRCNYDSMQIGAYLKLGASTMTTLDMGSKDCDGVIGHDIFSAIHGIIDHAGHRLWFPKDGKPADIGAIAKGAGLVGLELSTVDNHYLLGGTIGGKPVRFILDNGAQQSVLDTAVAKRLGQRVEYGVMEAVGSSGHAERMGMTSVETLALGPVKLRRAPLAVVSLAGVQSSEAGRFDGILGAEFLFATKALLDVGNNRLYVAATDVDSRAFAKAGGEMFESDAALKTACAGSAWVGAVRVKSAGVVPEIKIKGPRGVDLVGVQLEVAVVETYAGASKPADETLTVVVLCPARADMPAFLSGSIGRNPMKLLFLAPDVDGRPAARLMDETLWTDGDLPRAQLRRVLPGVRVSPYKS